MNPNENTPQQPLPTDYLDQIAPQGPQKSNLLMNKLMMIGLIVVVLVVAIFIAIVGLSGEEATKPTEQLYARLNATQTIAQNATKVIKNSHLSAINTDLKAYLTSSLTEIVTPLEKSKITVKKISKKVMESETNQKLVDELEDAKLNAIFDRTYPREMAYQLDTILTLMEKIKKTTTNTSLKTYLTDSIKNLGPIQDRLESFDSTQN